MSERYVKITTPSGAYGVIDNDGGLWAISVDPRPSNLDYSEMLDLMAMIKHAPTDAVLLQPEWSFAFISADVLFALPSDHEFCARSRAAQALRRQRNELMKSDLVRAMEARMKAHH
jgi:hypothetical protein